MPTNNQSKVKAEVKNDSDNIGKCIVIRGIESERTMQTKMDWFRMTL